MRGGVRKRGNAWYYYFELGTVGGKRKRHERRAVGATTKGEAQTILRKAISDYEDSGTLFEPSKTSVADYMEFWLEEYVELNLAYNTWDNYKMVIETHINPAIGNMQLSSIAPETLQKFINDKHRDGFARRTLTIFHSVLNNAFRQAVYPYKLIRENPMQYVKLPREERKKKTKSDLKIITLDQVQEILDFIGKVNTFYIPFQIGFHTGLRRGEVSGLEWDRIDLNRGTLEVDQAITRNDGEWVVGPPKNNSSYRTIQIGTTLISILKDHKLQQKKNRLRYGEHYRKNALKYKPSKHEEFIKEGNFVCTKENGEFVSPNSIKWSCSNIQGKLGIGFGFHSLRHTHATLLLERGAPIKDVQHRLGHARASITIDTYLHLTEKMQNQTIDIFENISNEIDH